MNKHSWYGMKKTAKGAASIDIFGEIGEFGIMADQFIASLRELGDVKTLDIHINSPGGYVTDGYAIYNFLSRHPAYKTAYVDGLAASMASVIFMAADRRIMPQNSLLMIHNPWGGTMGDAKTMRKDANVLEKMELQIARTYVDSSLLTIDEILALMDSETWLTAEDAVAAGFADEIEQPIRIAALFDLKKFKRGAIMAKFQKQNLSVAEIDSDDESNAVDPKVAKSIGDAAVKASKDRDDAICKLCKLARVSSADTQKFIDDEAMDAEKVLAALDEKRSAKGDDEVSAHNAGPKITTDGSGKAKINTAAIYARFNKQKAGVRVDTSVKD